jgi:ATP phosphoribosyltransferase regulatory subunit
MSFRRYRSLLSRAPELGYTPGAMSDDKSLGLLPEGLHDDLAPVAGQEAAVIEGLLSCFAGHGYERVKPPLIEFEESLLTGPGAQLSRHMFRLMDPISQRMMALRSDMTTQVARIAATRLSHVARPLRLCYAGQVLRVRGSQLRPERQFAQAGAELIGADSTAADADLLLWAAAAAAAIGVPELSIDLTVPGLVPILCRQLELADDVAETVRAALDRRDAPVLDGLAAELREPLTALLEAAGPAEPALAALGRLALPDEAGALVSRLAALVVEVGPQATARLTIDPGESRGFEYQTGVSFTLFAKGVRGELGRGGRYELVSGESATGFSLYLDSVLRALPVPVAAEKLYLPYDAPAGEGRRLRAEGWRVIRGLAAESDSRAEAVRLGCSHILAAGQIDEIA